MPLLDRLKERIETTDMTDGELTSVLASSTEDITDRFGAEGQITVTLEGRTRRLDLVRPADLESSAGIAIVEFRTPSDEGTSLEDDDFRIWHGGRQLERLATGTNGRIHWGARVEITYEPVAETERRDEATLKLAILSLQYTGLISEQIGDERLTPAKYEEQREAILATLQPRAGLFLR